VVVDGRGRALDAVAATLGSPFDQGGLRRVRLLLPELSPRTAQEFADRHSLDLVATPGLLRVHRSHLYTWGFSEDRLNEFWQWFLFADGDPSRSTDREALETLIAHLPEELRESFRLVMAHAEAGGPRAYGQWLANRFGAMVRVASGIPAVAWQRGAPALTPMIPGWRDFLPEAQPR
jgi:hypothetical protein